MVISNELVASVVWQKRISRKRNKIRRRSKYCRAEADILAGFETKTTAIGHAAACEEELRPDFYFASWQIESLWN
jgi:hypothetical protein